MPAVVRLENVSKRFILRHEKARSFQEALVNAALRRNGTREEFWALRDVSFEVKEGEVLGIVGENGSGKSTILKLITRILTPTAGKVAVDGKVSALIELGAGFHPDLTGRENVYLNGSILGIGRREMRSKLDEIVAFAELEKFIDTPVKHYSSGMYARLGFSVAISVEPDVLIIDEVLAVGDEAFQRKCMDRIRECRGKGVSIVLVSHALDAVRAFCDRAIWLEGGIVRLDSTPSEVVDSYFVESNLGRGHRSAVEGGTPRSSQSHGRSRWGSREVEITGVNLLDCTGRERYRFHSGDSLVIRMSYHAVQEVLDPVFGIAIHSSNGIQLTGPNTASTGFAIPRVSGDGWVDYRIEELPLLAGSYEVSVAVYDRTLAHAYDHHHRLYGLVVERGSVGDQYGLVRVRSSWHHAGSGLLASARDQ